MGVRCGVVHLETVGPMIRTLTFLSRAPVRRGAIAALLAIALAGCGGPTDGGGAGGAGPDDAAGGLVPAPRAETLVFNGRIYTADPARHFVEAFVVAGDEIVFAGTRADAEARAGADATRIDLEGRLVLPGLHDAHIHPIGAMDVSACDLKSRPLDLTALSAFVADCLARSDTSDGWFSVDLWSFTNGNQPTADYRTMREALDGESPTRPIILLGNDGHHYALNSAGLAEARNAAGEKVGFSAETLKTDFAALVDYIGVDARGEPDGRITEDYALASLGAGSLLTVGLNERRANPEAMMDVTLPRGITSFMDAAADPATLDIYDTLLARGAFKARATLALFFDPSLERDASGAPAIDDIMGRARAIRDRYADEPLIKADFLKVFADGVMEGDPLARPPTLPNAAASRPYLQPIFGYDAENSAVTLDGYVDTQNAVCAGAREVLAKGPHPDPQGFLAANGFLPRQCVISAGVLQHADDVFTAYLKAGAAAGFRFHIHAIGDRAVQTALDGLDGLDGVRGGGAVRDIITHLQLVRPADIARFDDNGPYASFTFAWVTRDTAYDTTVVPFVDRVGSLEAMYESDGYLWQNSYPAAAIKAAGGGIIAGSDAPVDTRDPRPFINIEGAVTRSISDGAPYNADQAISIFDAVDAYTRLAAEALGTGDETGQIAPGFKADFIIVSQDIFALTAENRAAEISQTDVLETWFSGERVYQRP